MDIFDALNMVGGLSLFLFGMSTMGSALERRAGAGLRSLLERMTSGRAAGLLTGIVVTAIIQSSSAATVMVVGFVNSGLMTLRQAVNVIMGANVGTTVTAWILSLAGISGGNIFVRLLKPSSFTPVLSLIGIILFMFCRSAKKKDTGTILLGFAVLMFGMETMSGAVAGLGRVPAFREMFIMFENPVLGVLAGAVLTALIQSSSASVGILQALALTGQVSCGAAVPIIMGQNIGTCVTALLSAVGANKNAKRAAGVHLLFNVIGTIVLLTAYCAARAAFAGTNVERMLDARASAFGIAVIHSAFNVLCTLIMLPMSDLLERIICRIVPDSESEGNPLSGEGTGTLAKLDERLLKTPSVAMERCRIVAAEMAECSAGAMHTALSLLGSYTQEGAESVREAEARADKYEDALGSYLVRLSSRRISERDSREAAKLLKIIGDLERISDYALNLTKAVEELRDKGLKLSEPAVREAAVMRSAVSEILDITLDAFIGAHSADRPAKAQLVEPLEQVIDGLKERLRTNHIMRLQRGECGIETGFVWEDMLTNMQRAAGHCSNIAGATADMAGAALNLHESLRAVRHDSAEYDANFARFAEKYAI